MKDLLEKQYEKWTVTGNILVKHISKVYNIEFKKVYSMFEQVHRGWGDSYKIVRKVKGTFTLYVPTGTTMNYLYWVPLMQTKRKMKDIEYSYYK